MKRTAEDCKSEASKKAGELAAELNYIFSDIPSCLKEPCWCDDLKELAHQASEFSIKNTH